MQYFVVEKNCRDRASIKPNNYQLINGFGLEAEYGILRLRVYYCMDECMPFNNNLKMNEFEMFSMDKIVHVLDYFGDLLGSHKIL